MTKTTPTPAASKKVKLSPPQELVKRRFESGDRIVHINKHHMSGGEWVWKSDRSVQRSKPVYMYLAAVQGVNWINVSISPEDKHLYFSDSL